MKTTALINVDFDAELKKAGISPTALKPGDTLRVRVLEILSDQRVLADFGKFRANAEITFPVNRGEELMVKVVETGHQLRFSVMQPGISSGNAISSFIDSLKFLSDEQFQQIRSEIQQVFNQVSESKNATHLPPSFLKALTQIQGHFSTLMIQDNISKLASGVKSYVENSGIFFENKIKEALTSLVEGSEQLSLKNAKQLADIKDVIIKDLKPNLLLLKDFLESREALSGDTKIRNLVKLKSAVDSLLSEIDNQQKLAVKKQIQPDPFQVLTFFLPLKEKNQNAKIKFYYPKKQKDAANNEFKISLLLNMDRMGEIRTDLTQRDKELTITFFVKDESNKDAFENNYSEIKSALNHLFEYIVLRTVISRKKIDDFQREDWVFSEDKRVDVRI
jgi:cellobiose-specific phosphotransferase system component IIA